MLMLRKAGEVETGDLKGSGGNSNGRVTCIGVIKVGAALDKRLLRCYYKRPILAIIKS